MKQTLLLLLSGLFLLSCSENIKKGKVDEVFPTERITDKIKVLNLGSFHFGTTSDDTVTEFDEKNKKNQKDVKKLAKMLAEFKPTIICVENMPEYNYELNRALQVFLQEPSVLNTNWGEKSMLGFEIARLSGVKEVYGIDNFLSHNYNIESELINMIDSVTYNEYTRAPFKNYPEIAVRNECYKNASFFEKMNLLNEPVFLDFLINTNTDKLLYVGTEDGFEGADEAAKFYQRNMRIYSNLNRIPMTKEDRVFILMGASHTAFLREFMSRSSKFEMVETLEYLKYK
jgi:hypothetical protein